MTIQGMSDSGYDYVNGAQLPGFVGKKVTIIGLVNNVVPGGTSFSLRSTDNTVVAVNLNSPLDTPLEGYVEVRGVSQGKAVRADEFVVFSNQQFDAQNYNDLCKLLHSVPNPYRI